MFTGLERLGRGLAIAGLFALAAGTPAMDGEVTGKGEQVDANGVSICKFSGQNDGEDPPGRVQSYGQDVVADLADPTDFDPDDPFSLHPGWFCDPNNFDAREILPR